MRFSLFCFFKNKNALEGLATMVQGKVLFKDSRFLFQLECHVKN